MKVPCGQCPAKYAILDERIQGKKVRIHCKRCGAAIVVDGKTSPPTITTEGGQRPNAGTDSVPPENPRPEAKTMLGGLEAPMHLREQRKAAAASPAAPRPIRTLRPAAPDAVAGPPGMPAAGRGFTNPPAADDGGQTNWRVALTEHDLRWMTTDEVVAAYNAGSLKPETFVLRQGMSHWQTLLEVAEFADAPPSSGAVNGKSANGVYADNPVAAEHGAGERGGGAEPAPPPAPRRASSGKRPAVFGSPVGLANGAPAATPVQSDTSDNEPFALIGGRPGHKPTAQLDESFLTLPFTDAEPIDSIPAPAAAPRVVDPPPMQEVATPLASPAGAVTSPLAAQQLQPAAPEPNPEHVPAATLAQEVFGIQQEDESLPKNHPIRPAPASPLWPWLIAAIVLVVIGVMVLSRV